MRTRIHVDGFTLYYGAPRARPFGLPDRTVLPEKDRRVGRPGMELWTVPVPGVLRQGLGCGFGRLRELL